MKKYILVLSLLPVLAQAQTTTKKAKPTTVTANKAQSKSVTTNTEVKSTDEFLITGNITGYPDSSTIDLLNASTGASEASSKIIAGKFSLKGKIASPDFRVLSVNMQPPYLSIFLDNSNITINSSKENFEKAQIKGSKSNDDFVAFDNIAKPYANLFNPGEPADPALSKNAAFEFENYINTNPDSYITPLAIYRYYQVTNNNEKLEAMYNNLPAGIQKASIGAYLATVIKENKKNPMGKPLPNFTQADTAGNNVSLSSLKGKYVLVDFWASWCGPCRQENPNIVATYNKFKDKNFTVIGVSLDKAKEPWLAAIDKDGLTWTHVSDLKGWSNAVAQQFEIFSIPQSFLLDPDGNVVGKNLRGSALEARLNELIK